MRNWTQEKDLNEQMTTFEEILNGGGRASELPTLESDRLTYEKAKAALEEVEDE